MDFRMNLGTKIKYFQIALLIWMTGLVLPGLAQDFPSRPTLTEMDQAMVLGTKSAHAVRNRFLALKVSWSGLPYIGTRAAYLATLQQKLEGLAPSFVNHVDGPLDAAKTNFVYFTLTTWRAAANLDSDGFRRYGAERTLVGHGIAQAQDVILTSAFGELAAGLDMLEWTGVTGPFNYERLTGADYYGPLGSGKTNWAESVAVAEANYLINKPVGMLIGLGEIEAWYASTYGWQNYRTTIRRTTKVGWVLQGWSAAVVEWLAQAVLYLRAEKYAGSEIGEHNSVFDNNGLGDLAGDRKWAGVITKPGPFTAGDEVKFIEKTDAPARCEDPKGHDPQGSWNGFYTIDSPTVLLQWNFAD